MFSRLLELGLIVASIVASPVDGKGGSVLMAQTCLNAP